MLSGYNHLLELFDQVEGEVISRIYGMQLLSSTVERFRFEVPSTAVIWEDKGMLRNVTIRFDEISDPRTMSVFANYWYSSEGMPLAGFTSAALLQVPFEYADMVTAIRNAFNIASK